MEQAFGPASARTRDFGALAPEVHMPGDVRMLVEHLAKNLVEAPDAVFVDVYDEDGGVEIELEVAEEDMGRVIGRSGRTARCLRNIVNAAGERAGKRYSLDILD